MGASPAHFSHFSWVWAHFPPRAGEAQGKEITHQNQHPFASFWHFPWNLALPFIFIFHRKKNIFNRRENRYLRYSFCLFVFFFFFSLAVWHCYQSRSLSCSDHGKTLLTFGKFCLEINMLVCDLSCCNSTFAESEPGPFYTTDDQVLVEGMCLELSIREMPNTFYSIFSFAVCKNWECWSIQLCC